MKDIPKNAKIAIYSLLFVAWGSMAYYSKTSAEPSDIVTVISVFFMAVNLARIVRTYLDS
mgnify:CR=1 FL=1